MPVSLSPLLARTNGFASPGLRGLRPNSLLKGGCDGQPGNSGVLLALEPIVGSRSCRHRAAPMLDVDADSSALWAPQNAPLPLSWLSREGGETVRRERPEANADAEHFPAGCAQAYNSHYAPPGNSAAPRWEAAVHPFNLAYTSSILLAMPLAFGELFSPLTGARRLTRWDLRRRGSAPEKPPVARGTPRTTAPDPPLMLGLSQRLPLHPTCGGGFAQAQESFLWRPREEGWGTPGPYSHCREGYERVCPFLFFSSSRARRTNLKDQVSPQPQFLYPAPPPSPLRHQF